MEFLAIMAAGTIIAILIVMGLRPKRPIQTVARDFSRVRQQPDAPPVWGKGAEHVQPMGELEYLEAIERHEKDPSRYPFPSPPPRPAAETSGREDF